MAVLEEERLPVIVIIDSAEDGRRKMMGAAFEKLATVQFAYNTGQRVILSDPENNDLKALEPALVTLRHFRDLPLAANNDTTITVYFGGNGGNDPAAPPSALYRIWRPISGDSGYLSSSEAKELLDFAAGIETQEQTNSLPSFLRDPRVFSLLPALLILCQGYLAAHSTSEAGLEVELALEHMGLAALLEAGGDDVALLRRVIPLKRAETSSPAWWTNVIGNNRKRVEEQIANEMGIFSTVLQPALNSLIDDIFAPNAEQLHPSVVAEAYCAIAAKLTGKPCQT